MILIVYCGLLAALGCYLPEERTWASLTVLGGFSWETEGWVAVRLLLAERGVVDVELAYQLSPFFYILALAILIPKFLILS